MSRRESSVPSTAWLLVGRALPETHVKVERYPAVGVVMFTTGPLTFLPMPKASTTVRVEPARSTARRLK